MVASASSTAAVQNQAKISVDVSAVASSSSALGVLSSGKLFSDAVTLSTFTTTAGVAKPNAAYLNASASFFTDLVSAAPIYSSGYSTSSLGAPLDVVKALSSAPSANASSTSQAYNSASLAASPALYVNVVAQLMGDHKLASGASASSSLIGKVDQPVTFSISPYSLSVSTSAVQLDKPLGSSPYAGSSQSSSLKLDIPLSAVSNSSAEATAQASLLVPLASTSGAVGASLDTLFRFVNTPSDRRAYVYRYANSVSLYRYNYTAKVPVQLTRATVQAVSNVAKVPV